MCPHDCLQDPANIEVSSPCARIMMVCVLRSKAEAWLRILLEDALRADVLAAKQRRSVAFDRSQWGKKHVVRSDRLINTVVTLLILGEKIFKPSSLPSNLVKQTAKYCS